MKHRSSLFSLLASSLLLSCLVAACAVGTSDEGLTSTETAPTDPTTEPPPDTLKAPIPGASTEDAGKDATADAKTDAAKDSGGASPSGCTGYAPPTTSAGCNACGSKPCQANGCYNGYYCDLSTTKCTPKPASCP